MSQTASAAGLTTTMKVIEIGQRAAKNATVQGLPVPLPRTTLQQPIPESASKVQDVRVDNWGNYCLQRLQAMYERNDYCDLTLQFQNLEVIKAHRVVINMCTDYFANLERLNGFVNGMLVLPKEVDYAAMLVIIKFFYTGKLEVRGAQFSDIYRTVKLMNINILIKLLEAHARKPEELAKRKPPAGQLVLKTGGGGPQVLKSLVHSAINSKSLPGSGVRKQLTVSRPLPAGVKTKTVLARVQQQPLRFAGLNRSSIRTNAALTPKKLPVWKERRTIIQSQEKPKYVSQKVEPAKPTRFEWPDPEEDGGGFKFSESLPEEFISQPQISLSSLSQHSAIVFDTVKTQIETLPLSHKHKIPVDSEDDISDAKMAKMNEDIEKELASMEGTEAGHENFETSAEDDMSNVFCQDVSEHAEVETSVEVETSEPEINFRDSIVSDVAVEEVVKSTPLKKVVKSVRFATELEKENKGIKEMATSHQIPASPADGVTSMSREDDPANHSKLISEILKRYPELVKDNKNVKLKIVQRGPPEAGCREGKSKTSYIVLKSSSSDAPGSVVLRKSSPSPARSKFWDTEDTVRKVSSAAENILGPWSCVPCGTTDAPEHFESYYLYRKHLVEVHHEKVDARICEYCGIKTSKRNLLLYHLYTKHSIEPPATHQFPHCDRCDYVALSWSLLQKHKQAHDTAKHLSCTICRASFKTSTALQYHIAANLHRNRDSKGQHHCPYCTKQFARLANLNTHIRSFHKDGSSEELEDDSDQNNLQQYEEIEEDLHKEEGLDNMMSGDGEENETIDEMEGSISLPIKIVPSSEAEALNNVASSIAASLDLGNQIHHEENGEFAEHILGDTEQEVYILDDSAAETPGDESIEGKTMVLENSVETLDTEGDFLVQDIHGNRFRKITGTDVEGNPIVFFQLTDETVEIPSSEQAVESSEEVATTVANHVEYCFDEKSSLSVQNDHMYLDPQKCSIFVSSPGGVPVPVSITSEMEHAQTLVSYGEDGTQVIELLPLNSQESFEIDDNVAPQSSEGASGNDGSDLISSMNATTPEFESEEISYEEDMTEQEEQVVEIMETSNPALNLNNEDGIIGV